MATTPGSIRLIIEDTARNRYECDIATDTVFSNLAADFFEDRGWPTVDNRGRQQRAVIELVDPDNPERTKRLRGELTPADASLWDGAVVRIFPESIAGAVNQRQRIAALVQDRNAMAELAEWNKNIRYEAKPAEIPIFYDLTLSYPGFKELASDGITPVIINQHRVEISLDAEYPLRPPRVQWKSKVFHPNIRTDDGAVCLGVLMEYFLPGLGLARIVTLLTEMVQWRNFDPTHGFNADASKWALEESNWHYIEEIGGYPLQESVQELLKELHSEWQGRGERPRLSFKPLTQ